MKPFIQTNSCALIKAFFLGILALASLSAQDDRLRLKQADVLENVTVDGVSMQYLRGNVIFTKGDMTMNCDWARFDQKKGAGLSFWECVHD